MITWNQGEMFVVEVVSFERLNVSGGASWELKVRFRNLTIEPTYFTQCLENTFSGDKNVTLCGDVVTIAKNVFLDNASLKRSLIEEAWYWFKNWQNILNGEKLETPTWLLSINLVETMESGNTLFFLCLN